jgi:IS605 OrfB family transposase
MSMQRTVRVRLKPTVEQRAILVETMRLTTLCFNAVAAYGWEHEQRNSVALHKATYYPLRADHPTLPSQLVVSARMRAGEAITSALTRKKQGRHTSCPTGSMVPIRYDARSYRLIGQGASLATVGGRQVIPFATNPHAAGLLAQATGTDSADVILRDGKLWLHAVVTLPDVPFSDTGVAVGVDLGLTRPAVTSEARFLGQKRWREVDRRYFRLKRSLQSKGTRSAKRHLRKLRGRVNRFRRDCDHVLSKRIVQSVTTGTTVVVENLTDIRGRVKQRGRASRRRLHSWSFAQLRGFLEYKAEAAGCRVVGVDPRHTSQRCHACGSVERGNRHGARFHCLVCGIQDNADRNAAINIRDRHLVGWASGPADGQPVKLPLVGVPVELQHGATHKLPALAGSS